MNIYLIFIILFSIVFVVSVGIFIYFIRDEKNLKEVSNKDLVKYGKTYSKEEMEEQLFGIYQNILLNIVNEDYSFLKDMVSDQIYNQLLLELKNRREKQEIQVITNIKKEWNKLIQFQVLDDLEIVKLWVRYSDIEYTKTIRKELEENQQEVSKEIIVEGNQEMPVAHEYILTFIRNKTKTEEIVCPNCGFQIKFLTSSHCIRCDQQIIPKTMHWVYVGKVDANLSNKK